MIEGGREKVARRNRMKQQLRKECRGRMGRMGRMQSSGKREDIKTIKAIKAVNQISHRAESETQPELTKH